MPLILACHVDQHIQKEFTNKSTGKLQTLDLLRITICNAYPDTSRDFYHSEVMCPKDVDPRSLIGWQWLIIPETTERNFGLTKLKGLDLNAFTLLAFTPENVLAIEGAFKVLNQATLSAAPPPPVYGKPNSAAPVTQRPDGMTVANKV